MANWMVGVCSMEDVMDEGDNKATLGERNNGREDLRAPR